MQSERLLRIGAKIFTYFNEHHRFIAVCYSKIIRIERRYQNFIFKNERYVARKRKQNVIFARKFVLFP